MPRGNGIGCATCIPVNEASASNAQVEVRHSVHDVATRNSQPIVNVLTEILANGEARPLPELPRLTRNQRREPQWVNRFIPISQNGSIFLKYIEELCEKFLSCQLIDLDSDWDKGSKIISLNPTDVLNLRNALNTILGEKNG